MKLPRWTIHLVGLTTAALALGGLVVVDVVDVTVDEPKRPDTTTTAPLVEYRVLLDDGTYARCVERVEVWGACWPEED